MLLIASEAPGAALLPDSLVLHCNAETCLPFQVLEAMLGGEHAMDTGTEVGVCDRKVVNDETG